MLNIDIDKIGYKWKGAYNASTTYTEGDVVLKDGDPHVYKSGNFVAFAKGQQDFKTNELMVKNGGITNIPGTQLIQKSDGTVNYDTPYQRSGVMVVGIGSDYENYCDQYKTAYAWHALMNDGSVKGCGDNTVGQLGVGTGDINYVRPVRVPFPKGTKIKKIVNSFHVSFFIDTNDELWACGRNIVYGGYGLSKWGTDHAYTPVNISQITALNGEKIVKLFVDFNDSSTTQYTSIMVTTQSGKVYAWGNNRYGCLGLGDDTHRNNPELIPFTENIPIKEAYVRASYHSASQLIDFDGNMYVSGEINTSLFKASNIYVHRKLDLWAGKKVINVRHEVARAVWSAVWQQNRNTVSVMVEDSNGDKEIYGRGTGSARNNLTDPYTLSWDRSLTNAPLWKKGVTKYVPYNTPVPITSTALEDQYAVLCTSNPKDHRFVSHYDQHGIIVDEYGYVYHIGRNDYWNAREGDVINPQNVWHQYDPSIAFGVEKLYLAFGHTALTAIALRNDGKIITFGYNQTGSARFDYIPNIQDHHGVRIPPLPFDCKVVDIFQAGYWVENYSGQINHRQFLLLTEEGELYIGGRNDEGTLATGTTGYLGTFQKVHF